MAEKKLSFEHALDKLEKTVKALETGDLALDEMLKLFEEGVGLVKTCQSRLNEAEQKVEVLVQSMGADLAGQKDEGRREYGEF